MLKKKIVIVFAIGLFLGAGIVQGICSNVEKSSDPDINKDLEIIQISFEKPIIKEQNQYKSIEINEANSIVIREDKPLLPSYIHTFKFPLGTEIVSVTCSKGSLQQQTIEGEIMLSPDPILLGQSIEKKQKESTSLYPDPYPDKLYEYDIGCGIDGSERCIFVKVQVFPVEYHQSKNLIKWTDSIEIKVEYKEPIQPVFFDETYRLIVITPSEFSDELGDLINHKNNRDVPTKLVTLTEIYNSVYFPVQGRDDAEKIKYFIKNAIENWGITNVLLIGGFEKFPTRETHIKVSDDEEIFVSDLYYADIYNENEEFVSWDSNENSIFAEYDWEGKTDKVDLYPDVHLGRLACINSEDVTTCVNKIIAYETNEAYTKDWFNNIVVIGGDTVPKDDSGIDEGEYVNQKIIDIMDGFIPDKIWDSNKRLSGISPTGLANINNALNSGCGFVDWSGHGSPKVWTTYPHDGNHQSLPTPWGSYLNSNINDLTNDDKLPIAINGGCSLGKYNKNDNCFAWAYLSNPNGGGIASCGATALGYIYLGKYVTEGLIEGLTVDMFQAYKDGAKTFGEMWSGGINEYITTRMESYDYKTLEEWQPFGDPTLAIAEESIAPNKPDAPVGPVSGAIDIEHTYTASTTDDDGDKLYYLFDWDDGTYSEWIGPKNSGQTASASHSWSTEGDYSIKVIAKDEHGKQSEWSDPLAVSMPRNRAMQTPFLKSLEQYPILYLLLQRFFQI